MSAVVAKNNQETVSCLERLSLLKHMQNMEGIITAVQKKAEVGRDEGTSHPSCLSTQPIISLLECLCLGKS